MRRRRAGARLVAAVAVLAAIGVACSSSGPKQGTPVAVTLDEYTIDPVPASVPAGAVTFDVLNIGGESHNLLVIRTDLEPGGLPITGSVASEEGTVGRTDVLATDAGQSVTVDLQAGHYVLICNVPEHYGAGMYTGFTIT